MQHIFYELLIKLPTSRHLVSQFVNASTATASSLHIRDAWVKDVGVSISAALWVRILIGIKDCSINTRLQLIQFKVVQCLHYSKVQLSKIFLNLSSVCDRCEHPNATLGHQHCHNYKYFRSLSNCVQTADNSRVSHFHLWGV